MARCQLLSLIAARQHQKVADPWFRVLTAGRILNFFPDVVGAVARTIARGSGGTRWFRGLVRVETNAEKQVDILKTGENGPNSREDHYLFLVFILKSGKNLGRIERRFLFGSNVFFVLVLFPGRDFLSTVLVVANCKRKIASLVWSSNTHFVFWS